MGVSVSVFNMKVITSLSITEKNWNCTFFCDIFASTVFMTATCSPHYKSRTSPGSALWDHSKRRASETLRYATYDRMRTAADSVWFFWIRFHEKANAVGLDKGAEKKRWFEIPPPRNTPSCYTQFVFLPGYSKKIIHMIFEISRFPRGVDLPWNVLECWLINGDQGIRRLNSVRLWILRMLPGPRCTSSG